MFTSAVEKSRNWEKRRFTQISSGYKCKFCGEDVDISEERHEMEFCRSFVSDPIFGGKEAYTPSKKARLIELTVKQLDLENIIKYPP